jgi:hypothetical protein
MTLMRWEDGGESGHSVNVLYRTGDKAAIGDASLKRDGRGSEFWVLSFEFRELRASNELRTQNSELRTSSPATLLALAAGYHLSEALPLASSPLILLRI